MTDAAFCYVATLVILGHKRVLFRLAHEWVETSPKSAQAWFAVGAYYFCCERYHVAQRHFCRATRLDPQCTEAWIAFGCSFAPVTSRIKPWRPFERRSD
jgi:anaphase-promoting complex subunit 6